MSARRATKAVATGVEPRADSAKSDKKRASHSKSSKTIKTSKESDDMIALVDSSDDDVVEEELDEVPILAFDADMEDDGKGIGREDPQLDRRIIEGMLHDRERLFVDLSREGIGKAAILRRAAELGLSEALIRQLRGVAADLAGDRQGSRRPIPSSLGARTCLSCDRVFLSSGPGNRLCMRCRGGDAGLAQL